MFRKIILFARIFGYSIFSYKNIFTQLVDGLWVLITFLQTPSGSESSTQKEWHVDKSGWGFLSIISSEKTDGHENSFTISVWAAQPNATMLLILWYSFIHSFFIVFLLRLHPFVVKLFFTWKYMSSNLSPQIHSPFFFKTSVNIFKSRFVRKNIEYMLFFHKQLSRILWFLLLHIPLLMLLK